MPPIREAFSLVATLAVRYRTYRRRVRGERMLRELSPAMRKDIGWPDPDRWP